MKISVHSRQLLTEALDRDRTISGFLYTDRPPNAFEREQLASNGCTFLDNPAGTVNRVRLQASDFSTIINLGFVEQIELFA